MTERIKKGISSNKKKSWRKQISSKNIEDFIYEKGNEETDIKLISNKSDQDLFTVDSEEDKKLQISSKQKRKLNALKKLEILKNGENKDNKNGVNELNVKQRKIFRAIKNGRRKLKLKNNKLKRGSMKYLSKDVWDESADDDKLQQYKGEWISKELTLHHLHGTGQQLVKVHESAHHKTSLLKAFQPPHPGLSYNPSYKDYYKLIEEVVEKETDIIKRDQHLNRVTTQMFTKIPITEHDQLKNLQNMITDENIKSEPTDSEDDKTVVHRNPEITREKKKTKTVRNKEKKLKSLMKKTNSEKEKRKQIADLYRIKSILKDISKTEIENEIKSKIQNIKKIQKKFEPKRLSKVKFEEPDVDVFMPNELPNGLRNIETKTKLIVDRFKDFQRRNILPPSVDVGKRKSRKVKHFIRKSHKETK